MEKKIKLNELRTLVRQIIKEEVQIIKITRSISDEGNKQININVLGGGLEKNGEIVLSFEEAKQLHQLAEQFLRERRTFSKAVNTEDIYSTQSTIQIQAKGLKCIISRQEGSVYKGYDEPSGSSTGYFVANQSIVYQLVEKLLNNLNELEDPNNKSKQNTVPSAVMALDKAQQASSAFMSKAEDIDSIVKFSGAFKIWMNTLGIKPDKVKKSTLETEIRKVLSNLGFN